MTKYLKPILNKLMTVMKYSLSGVFIVAGILGLTVLYINPLQYLGVVYQIQIEGTSISVDQALMQSWLTFLHTNLIATVAISSTLLLMGIFVHARNFKVWWLNLRKAPMGIVRSPVRAYQRVSIWRNWLLVKVTALNEESAKWKMTFKILVSPYSFLRMMGLSPQMAVGLLFAGTAAGSGVVVNETMFAERSFERGDSGVYAASVIGNNAPLDVPTSYSDSENTLRIDLGSTPVREITIENVSVGTVFTGSALPSGEANVVQISGNTISGGTNTRLEIGHLIFENSRCKKLTLTDIQAHTLIVRGNASDGQSLAPSPGTSRMRAIGGGHQQADAMVTNGGTYDRIWIQAPSSGVNGKIGTLRLSNLYTKGGDCVLSKINVGTIEILLNEVGMGNGFSTKEFTISTTVTASNITIEDNVEVTIAEPTTN